MNDVPLVEPPADTAPDRNDDRREVHIAGVLLAAGTSTRFGDRNKLLERVDGEPLVRRAAKTMLEAGVGPVVVVLGHEADRVEATLADLGRAFDADVRFVENPNYADGQSTSVGAGVRALPADVDAALFALGDMPWVSATSIEALVTAYLAGSGTALAAAHEGERGNPVLWDAVHFDALADQSGDVGGRDLLLEVSEVALVETGDPGVRRDVDRPPDLD